LSWESIIDSISSNIVPIIAAIITTAGSIIGIIITLSQRVKKEIELKREIELFDRKQKAYRDLIHIIFKYQDHSYFIGSQVNWKIIRHVYNELILIGSKEVLEKTNELFQDVSPDSQGTNALIKELWKVIRKDLYKEDLTFEQMHMITPMQKTVDAKVLVDKYFDQLKSIGIDTPEKASLMDVDKISVQSNISKTELESIKEMVKNELEYEKELKKFLEEK
jgi:hypothetical protein